MPSQTSSLSHQPQPTRYRRGVGILLLNARQEVFMGQRRDIPSAWQMPQGGVDQDEPLLTAALRELYEETGVSPEKVQLLHKSKKWRRYDLPDHLIGKTWKGKYRGQKQKWFMMLFTGQETTDINLSRHTYQEFQDWRWIALQDLLTWAVPFKRTLYQSLLEEFSPVLQNIALKKS